MPRTRLAWRIGTIVLALLAALGPDRPAQADTLLLNNGDFVVGELQLTELAVVSDGQVVRVEPREAAGVALGTVGGDVVHLRTGRALTGRVDQAAYTIRLPSGQSVVVERHRVGQLYLSPR